MVGRTSTAAVLGLLLLGAVVPLVSGATEELTPRADRTAVEVDSSGTDAVTRELSSGQAHRVQSSVEASGQILDRLRVPGVLMLFAVLVFCTIGSVVTVLVSIHELADADAPVTDRVQAIRQAHSGTVLVFPVFAVLSAHWLGALDVVSIVSQAVLPVESLGAWWRVTKWFVALGPFAGLPWLAITLVTRPKIQSLLGGEYQWHKVATDWAKEVTLKAGWFWLVGAVLLTFASQILASPIVGGILVGLLTVFWQSISPLLILLFNDARPLTGEERESVIGLFREKGLSVRGLYRLDTEDTVVAQGLIAGLFGNHWIFLTDDIVDEFSPEQVAAVVAHELGHAAHRHHLKRAAFAVVYWFLVFWLYANVIQIVWLLVFSVVVYWQFGLGWVGIRQEFEADAYAATLTSPTAMQDALQSIATVNAMPNETGTTHELTSKHPSIERRLDRLDELAEDEQRSSRKRGQSDQPGSTTE
ncbi:M48 family metalloprotease [Halomicrobium sp. HM KBTZ05]|uniref:M48 family metalloprotease n=1 Tax=Halomicrobium sp. HM KBTZ05 TaxID=3242663 RepID=UPI0035560B4F